MLLSGLRKKAITTQHAGQVEGEENCSVILDWDLTYFVVTFIFLFVLLPFLDSVVALLFHLNLLEVETRFLKWSKLKVTWGLSPPVSRPLLNCFLWPNCDHCVLSWVLEFFQPVFFFWPCTLWVHSSFPAHGKPGESQVIQARAPKGVSSRTGRALRKWPGSQAGEEHYVS